MGGTFLLPQHPEDSGVSILDKKTPDETSEKPLTFSDASMGFLYTFDLNLKDEYLANRSCGSLDIEKVTMTLNQDLLTLNEKFSTDLLKLKVKQYIEKWNCDEDQPTWIKNHEFAEDFESIEQFLSNSTNIFAKHYRFELGKMSIKYPDSSKKNHSDTPGCHRKELELFLNIYPSAKAAIFFFILKLTEDKHDCNDLIFLRQHFMENRHGLCTKKIDNEELPYNVKKCIENINDSLNKAKKECKTGKEEYYKWIINNSELKELPRKFVYKKKNCTNFDCLYYSPIIKKIGETFNLLEKDVFPSLYENLKDDDFKMDCIEKIQQSLGKNFCTSKPSISAQPTNIIEIRDILPSVGTRDCMKDLIKNYPQQIYSLLVGDEGWEYVPRQIAISRIEKKAWSSRGFFSVFTIDKSVLLFNVIDKKYTNHQKGLCARYDQNRELYFKDKFLIPGAQHGPLFWLEIFSIVKWYSDTISECLIDVRTYFGYLEEFDTTKREKKIITKVFPYIPMLYSRKTEVQKMLLARDVANSSILSLDEINKIWEAGQLGNLIYESLSIPSSINKLENRLKIIENNLSIQYQAHNDSLVMALMIWTLVATIFGIFIGQVFR